MKLLELLTEDAINNFLNAGIGYRIGPDDGPPEAVQQIQRLLSQHSLARGDRPQGGWWDNSVKAWTGPINGRWTPQLTDAVRAWQTSVNNQLGSNTLAVDGVITDEDVEYLRDYPRYDRNTGATRRMVGFLRTSTSEAELRNLQQRNRRRNTNRFSAELGDPNPESLESLSEMLAAIGRNGWIGVLTPIINEKYADVENSPEKYQRARRDTNRLLQQIWNNRNNVTQWLTAFDNRIMQGVPTNLTSRTIQGEEVTISPPNDIRNLNGPTLYMALFNHFADIATYHLRNSEQVRLQRERQQAEQAAQARQNETVNISDDRLTGLANALDAAFKNELLAGLLPGGRRFSNDIEQIEWVLSQLRNARDWDALEETYNEQFNDDLSQRFIRELDEDDYERIVRIRLLAIRRINPRAMHRAINFGDNNSIRVNVNNRNYTIQKEYIDSAQIRPEVQDAILEDTILKAAIEQTQGEIPDLYTEFSRNQIQEATELFILVIQSTYPEMVAWYTHQPPFDSTVDIGQPRMQSIIDEAALAIQQTNDNSSAAAFIQQQILNDRIWLVGENNETDGAANVHFDDRYKNEGVEGRNWTETPERVDLIDDDIDLIQRLAVGDEEIRLEAVNEILEKNNPRRYYTETIYPGYLQEIGTYIDLDEETINENTVQNIVQGQRPDDSVIGIISSEIGVIYAAPSKVINLIEETFEFGFTTGGTDEETLTGLLNFINSPEKYNYINQYYKGKHGIDLIDALRTEDDLLGGLDLSRFETAVGYIISGNEQDQINDNITEILEFFRDVNRDFLEGNLNDEELADRFNSFELVEKLQAINDLGQGTTGISQSRRATMQNQLGRLRSTPLGNNTSSGMAQGVQLIRAYNTVEEFVQAKELYDEMMQQYS